MSGQLNSGTFMAVKGGKMVSMWEKRMHETYTGGWAVWDCDSLFGVRKRREMQLGRTGSGRQPPLVRGELQGSVGAAGTVCLVGGGLLGDVPAACILPGPDHAHDTRVQTYHAALIAGEEEQLCKGCVSHCEDDV